MRSPQIRERFLDFFASRGHQRLPSASLLTFDDPSILFTVAGMVPLKPYILGLRPPPSPRVASCQKCFRGSGMLDDIAEVGDTTHLTFFEMLGNWSFGDYFKEGAITLAMELLTGPYGLEKEHLWPSIYPDDEESLRVWTQVIGVPDAKVSRLRDNWWQAGPTGPCGYDSEIHHDFGAPCSCGRDDCTPQDECGGDRFVEIWNLVFMEFDQAEDGRRTPLPTPVVDTGMGLERLTSVLQGVRSVYETDLFSGIVAGFRARAAAPGAASERTVSFNILADHLRSASLLVTDGVHPSNEGRGYVLRRVIRRAAVHGRRVGLQGGLAAGVGDLVEVMGDAYPELRDAQARVERTLRTEEEAFAQRVAAGEERLLALLARGEGRITGADAFRLHDTHGFPVELTVELAREHGVEVDAEGYRARMTEQRERARAARQRVGFAGAALPPSTFVGYDTLECEATVLRIGEREELNELRAGGTAVVVLEPTPFYAEGGGQVGDQGTLTWGGGRARVEDTVDAGGDTRVSRVTVESGTLHGGAAVMAAVDAPRRAQTARHHSATHLLNRALRIVLGDEVTQRGSWVGPTYTTFDFSFSRALTDEEVAAVEGAVNAAIRRDLERRVDVLPVAAAKASGAISMAGERYPEAVRVVSFGDWSRELCGGTHVERTGQLGAAIVLSERSIGTGLRRIEMRVGEAAEQHWRGSDDRLRAAAAALQTSPADLVLRAAALRSQVRTLQRELAEARRQAVVAPRGGEGVEEIHGVRLGAVVADVDRSGVHAACDEIFSRLQGDGVALVLGSDSVMVKVGGNAAVAGVDARELVRAVNAVAGGRGGGRGADRAEGGIDDAARRVAAVDAVRGRLAHLGNGSAGGAAAIEPAGDGGGEAQG